MADHDEDDRARDSEAESADDNSSFNEGSDDEEKDEARIEEERDKEREDFEDLAVHDTDAPRKGIITIGPPAQGEEDRRKSIRSMTRFEYTRLIAQRAEMISKDDPPVHPKFNSNVVNTDDPITLAQLELDDTSIPFVLLLVRPIDQPLRGRIFEVFNVRELMLPDEVERYRRPGILFDKWRVSGQVEGVFPSA